MSNTEPTSDFVCPSDPWQQQELAYARIASEVLTLNKAAVFTALAAAGITTVIVTFDGYGDSGQIAAIEVRAGDDSSALPAVAIETASAHWGGATIDRQLRPVRVAIETLVHDVLNQKHGDCDINASSCSTFTFDVSERTITLGTNERHMKDERALTLTDGGSGYAAHR